jgi:prepilin-type N-terminal cleavage/methylation domain-containing protein
MPTSSVGKIIKTERGITLIEMLVVVTIVALVAGISYPSIAAGLDSLRLRSASDSIVAFLNTALDRAERRQEAVEIRISPKDNGLSARSASGEFARDLQLPKNVRIANPVELRQFLLYPGGSVPAMTVDLATADGRRHRVVSIDPITGVPEAR